MRTLVIGAAGGIGRALVRGAFQRGDSVAAVDIIMPDHKMGYCGTIDVRDSACVNRTVTEAAVALGGLDAVINASGVIADSPLTSLSDEEVTRVIDTNLIGAFRITRATAAHFGDDGGSIVHFSSVHAGLGVAGRAAYAASKGGLEAMIRVAAAELGPAGVTVNGVAPGPVGDGMGKGPSKREVLLKNAAIKRASTVNEVAATALFLTSTSARSITGQTLAIDGGAGVTMAPALSRATETAPLKEAS